MSFNNTKGLAHLQAWTAAERLRYSGASLTAPGGRFYCPKCRVELHSFFGRHSRQHRILHHSNGGRCPLEFRSWHGATPELAAAAFMEFSYGYRDEQPAVEVPQGDEPPAEEAAGEDGGAAIGGGDEPPDEGGAGFTDDINRLLEDAGNHPDESCVWEEIDN